MAEMFHTPGIFRKMFRTLYRGVMIKKFHTPAGESDKCFIPRNEILYPELEVNNEQPLTCLYLSMQLPIAGLCVRKC